MPGANDSSPLGSPGSPAGAATGRKGKGPETLEAILERFPSREVNAAALDAERLAAAIGIDLAPQGIEGRSRPGPDETAFLEKVLEPLKAWVRAELGKVTPQVAPPPKEVAAFLGLRAEAVRQFRRGILRGEPPLWEERLDRLDRAPMPSMLGHVNAQSVLAADALVRIRSGEPAAALENLEASWRLNEGLLENPRVIARLIGLVAVRYSAGLLRRLDDVPSQWRNRLRQQDPVAALLEALRVEADLWPHLKDPLGFQNPGMPPADNPEERLPLVFRGVAGKVTRPWFALMVADASRRQHAHLHRVESLIPLCDTNLAALDEDLGKSVPFWNTFGEALLGRGGGAGSALERAARLQLDLEMTSKILDLKAARMESGGRWPAALAGVEASQACPSLRWRYEAAANGSMSLALSREPNWAYNVLGLHLPTRFVSTLPTDRKRRESLSRRSPR